MIVASAPRILRAIASVPKLLRKMKVDILSALTDNYMYVIHDNQGHAVVVDPYDYCGVADYVEESKLNLTHVLTTHHHSDHAGGNASLLKCFTELTICGGSKKVNSVNKIVKDGEVFSVGSMVINCISTPGHTMDHICYYINDFTGEDPSCVFTGDTLFIGGCGKLFEGTPLDMYNSLVNKLGSLPKETLVYCGHEYTVNNLRFANSVCPFNGAIKKSLVAAKRDQENGQPTVPSTIGQEMEHNVFMMVKNPEMLKTFNFSSPVDLLGHLRNLKNNFK